MDSSVELAAVPAPTPEKADLIYAQQSREKRLANYEKTKELYAQGWKQKQIAQHLGIGVKTVSRYLKQSTFLERQYRKDRGQGVLDPYKSYLLERWNSGVRQGRKLYEEIKSRGYQHSYNVVASYLRRLKKVQVKENSPPVQFIESPYFPLTARRAAFLVIEHEGERNEESKQLLSQLKKYCSRFNEAITLAQDFTQMLRSLKSENFDEWLKRALESNLASLASFARGLNDDYEA